MFKPLQLLLNRVEAHGSDSDITLFTELLYDRNSFSLYKIPFY